MIKDLDSTQRDIAMSTIIYQSDMRARDPVGGCYSLIQQLQSQIDFATAELHLVLQHLAFFRAQQQASNNNNNNNLCDVINVAPPPRGFLEEMPQPHDQLQQQFELQQQQQQFGNYNSMHEDMNMWAMQNMIPLSPLPLSSQEDINHDQDPVVDYGYDDQKPVLDLMDKMKSDEASSGQVLNHPS